MKSALRIVSLLALAALAACATTAPSTFEADPLPTVAQVEAHVREHWESIWPDLDKRALRLELLGVGNLVCKDEYRCDVDIVARAPDSRIVVRRRNDVLAREDDDNPFTEVITIRDLPLGSRGRGEVAPLRLGPVKLTGTMERPIERYRADGAPSGNPLAFELVIPITGVLDRCILAIVPEDLPGLTTVGDEVRVTGRIVKYASLPLEVREPLDQTVVCYGPDADRALMVETISAVR